MSAATVKSFDGPVFSLQLFQAVLFHQIIFEVRDGAHVRVSQAIKLSGWLFWGVGCLGGAPVSDPVQRWSASPPVANISWP